ncbi:MAG: hypothetical protein WC934_14725 [Acidithiobacillus sp.]|jgi:hypothetical protein|uniref:hypothetical protein n=1 Tax=Acidithiobacillus sp. TaxID=1872118 RepID=UPI003560A9ED
MSYNKISEKISNTDVLKIKKKSINVQSKSMKQWNVYVGNVNVGKINGQHTWVKRKPSDRLLTKMKWQYSSSWNYDNLKQLYECDITIGRSSTDFSDLYRYPSSKDVFDIMKSQLIGFAKQINFKFTIE